MEIVAQNVSKAPVRRHSKTGCITCKVRKKRCSEDKPICSDCARLGFTCVYVPKSADRSRVRKYKDQVEVELFVQKNKGKSVGELESTVNSKVSNDENGSAAVAQSTYIKERALSDEFEIEQPSKGVVHLTKDLSALYLLQSMSDPVALQLDPIGMHLYDYYRYHLGKIISIAPIKQNYYLQVFLPMAHQHKGILCGLLAWSAHHLSVSQEDIETRDGDYYGLANRYTLESLKFLRSEINTSSLWSLAQLLILCGAEICQGDVSKWMVLLQHAADIMKKNVGEELSQLLNSSALRFDVTTRYWLLANFIYHDVMGSRGTQFPVDEYRALSNQNGETSNPISSMHMYVDPLHGINRPILLLIGDITNLTREMKSLGTFGKSHPQFRAFMRRASELQTQLFQILPDVRGLKLYEDSSLMYTLCLELFQLMKLSALLHLKTTCLRQSKYTWEIQHLWIEIFEKLDLILGTKLESCLCFPMFICGVNATDQEQKRQIESRFGDIAKRFKFYNFQRARTVMRKVWLQDDGDIDTGHSPTNISCTISATGNLDWYDIVDAMGWDISFA